MKVETYIVVLKYPTTPGILVLRLEGDEYVVAHDLGLDGTFQHSCFGGPHNVEDILSPSPKLS